MESALEGVNTAAARMGYNPAVEEGEEEGPVFSAAAADAITSRLRDLDDGCVGMGNLVRLGRDG